MLGESCVREIVCASIVMHGNITFPAETLKHGFHTEMHFDTAPHLLDLANFFRKKKLSSLIEKKPLRRRGI